MMTSHCCQPSASISARVVGRKGAGRRPAASASDLENRGAAVCTPGLDPIPRRKYNDNRSPEIDRNVDLRVVALNQQGDAMARRAPPPASIRPPWTRLPIDAQHHIARLQTGGQRRPADVLDDQVGRACAIPAVRSGFERPHREPELAAAVHRRRCAPPASAGPRAARSSPSPRSPCGHAKCRDEPRCRAAAAEMIGGQIEGMIDGMPVDAGDDVAGLEARALSRDLCGSTALISAPCGVAKPNDLRELLTDVLHRDADTAAAHLAVFAAADP